MHIEQGFFLVWRVQVRIYWACKADLFKIDKVDVRASVRVQSHVITSRTLGEVERRDGKGILNNMIVHRTNFQFASILK